MTARLSQAAFGVVVLVVLAWSVHLGLLPALLTSPTAEFSYAGIFLLYLCSAPGRYELAAVGVAGIAIRLIEGNSAISGPDYWLEPLFRVVALFGLAGIAALAVRAGVGKTRTQAVSILVRILIFAVLGVGIGLIVDLASRIRPLKLDPYLQAIEQAFGFLPNVLVAHWFATVPGLLQLELVVYNSLPLGLALVYAVHLKWPRGRTDILFLLYMNALIGFSLYMLYPACGPAYAFRDLTSAAVIDLRPVALDCKPNAMPSLHFAGAVLMCWNLRWFSRYRWITWVYLILTGVATLGFREHYAMDLIVAGPYALLIQALATESSRRTQTLAAAIVLLFGWLAMDRFGVPILTGSRVLLWSLTLATIAACWVAVRMLQTGDGNGEKELDRSLNAVAGSGTELPAGEGG